MATDREAKCARSTKGELRQIKELVRYRCNLFSELFDQILIYTDYRSDDLSGYSIPQCQKKEAKDIFLGLF